MASPNPQRASSAPGWSAPAGAVAIALLATVALLAPWLAPADPAEQLDPVVGRHLSPGSRLVLVRLTAGRTLLAEQARPAQDGLTVLRQGSWLTIPAQELAASPPAAAVELRSFLLGTDRYGRDLLSRILYGARTSLRIAALAVALALLAGVGVGAAAGLGPHWMEGLLMRAVDGLMAFPRLLLALLLAALWRSGEAGVIAVLAATGWMEVARLVRGEVLSLKERDFVLAARAAGVPAGRLVVRHLLPLVAAPVTVLAALRVGDTILTEAALSFLGFGIRPPDPSWGNIIADGRDTLLAAWWVAALPGSCIVLTVLSFALAAEGFSGALDRRRPG